MTATKLIGNIITPDRIIKDGEVCFSENRITYVGTKRNNDIEYNIIDYSGLYIAPGFIDIHIHGGGGHDFTDGTIEAFLGVAQLHAQHGTATMLSTTLSCTDEELFSLFNIFEKAKNTENNGSYLAGIHIEGPYVALSQKGAQDERYIKTPNPEHYNKILEKSNSILRWTIAPELDGAMELGRKLRSMNILPCIGHSDALYETALEAYENGFTIMTHFYSGMSSMIRKQGFRFPGLIESGYLIENMDVEIIADGCHLPAPILNYVWKQKGPDRVALVTDSMRAAGQTEGVSVLGSKENGLPVIIEDGVAKLMDKTAFGGSIATTDRLVRTMVQTAAVPLLDTVKMMTRTPARIVGLKNKGTIAPNFDADFTVFDNNINIMSTISNGKTIYKA
ncbi:MAG: N-acetylglucosamine-6-phosphate deacetylase [Clostridiales bacterium GWF2_38_85]|nr:MAG: N-acetylglucosamine-6-phosphate deacetylase [Clostridiales bacterium GWF2_38_85]HBL83578.1 N-acetylglucosamine-6-phosphate deacetylase [Clostridiales bacterium]